MQRCVVKPWLLGVMGLISHTVLAAADMPASRAQAEQIKDSAIELTSRSALAAGTPTTEIIVSVAEIHAYGIFETRKSQHRSGFSRNTMAADAVTGIRFTDFTTQIPAKKGVNFGFEYSINATPKGQRIPIRSIIRFPEPGLQHPGGKHYNESVELKYVNLGRPDLHGYGFDEVWEIVPGEWVFEIWHKDARLIKKTFTVVAEEVKTPDEHE